MEEGEHELCLVEPTLEPMEETPLEVQVRLLEEMAVMEALAAEVVLEEEGDTVQLVPLLAFQEQMEVSVELVAMEAAAVEEELEAVAIFITTV